MPAMRRVAAGGVVEDLARARSKLDNPRFAESAPPEVVAKTRAQLEEHDARMARLRVQLEELS